MLRDEYGAHRSERALGVCRLDHVLSEWCSMYLPFYPDHWTYGPAHSPLDSPDLALVRTAALHMLAQCEQCARCAGPEEFPSALEISPR